MRFVALVKLVVAVVLMATGTAAVVAAVGAQAGRVPGSFSGGLSLPEFPLLAQRSEMFDTYGNRIGVFSAVENREPVTLDRIPVAVRYAVLATEDAGFYQHRGVNARSLLRAFTSNLASGSASQGGSTITQQLVKNSFTGAERTADRKLREAALAVKLEREHTKDWILERYLNTVYFGNGAYGIQAAAEVYFGVSPSELTVPQAALLAGLIRNPGRYDPFRNPDSSRFRRKVVLDRMVEEGWLTEKERDEADMMPLPERPVVTPAGETLDTYFVEWVKQLLLDDPRLGATREQRNRVLFTGGLKIHTTYDPVLQFHAEQAVRLLPEDPRGFVAAVAVVEPGTGAVKALVGGPGVQTSEYNIAVQRPGRQPGSSFKAFVLAAAYENGVMPFDRIDASQPCSFPNPPQPDYRITGGRSGGVEQITSLTARSGNCGFVRLSLAVGVNRVAEMAARLGLTTPLPVVPSLALGTAEVTPLDMASAYGVFAAEGVRNPPFAVTRVETADGQVLFEHRPDPVRVLDTDVARRVTQSLEGVVTGGTGRAAKLGDGRPVVGKTGTTDDYTDAWFVGYTPHLAAAVWVGSPSGRVPMKNVGGVNVTGGTYPARIFSEFMTRAHEAIPRTGFVPPRPNPFRPTPARVWLPGVECVGGRTPKPGPGQVPLLFRNEAVWDCRKGPPRPAAPTVPTGPETPPVTVPVAETPEPVVGVSP